MIRMHEFLCACGAAEAVCAAAVAGGSKCIDGDGAVKVKADELKVCLDLLPTSTNGLVCQLDDFLDGIVGCGRSCPISAANIEFPRTNE
jgi:hypothetical protein